MLARNLNFSRKCHIDRSLLNTQHYENEKLFVGIVGLRSAVWSLPQRLILEQGGAGILGCVEPESTYWGADIEILRHYLETDLGKTVGAEYGEPQGRIKINNNLQLWE